MAIDKVTSAGLTEDIITGQTAETTIADDDLILLSDTSASAALKKMTRANFVSGIGGTNTPAFQARSNSGQSVSNTTHTDVVFGEEIFDTDSAFASNVFTVPSGKGGKYVLYAQAGRQGWDSDRFLCYLSRNRSGTQADLSASESAINSAQYHTTNTFCIADLQAGDVVKVIVYHDSGSTRTLSVGDRTCFQGFKLL